MGTSVRYGITCGLMLCSWVMSEYLMGLHNEHFSTGLYFDLAGFIILGILLYLSLKEQRKLSPSKAGFGTLFSSGIIMTCVAGCIIASFFFAYNNYINPDWIEGILEMEAEYLMVDNQTPEDLSAAADNYRFFTEDSTQLMIIFGTVFLSGTIMTLLFSVLLKQQWKGDQ